MVEIVKDQVRILLTGGTGQFGKSFLNQPSSHVVYAPDRNELDLANKDKVLESLKSFMPEVVINSGAWTDVPGAELNPAKVYETNVIGVEALLMATSTVNAKFIQLSTDYVFDGESSEPYVENSKKNPLSIYGKSKSEAEDLILEKYLDNAYVIRTSWLYSEYGRNFVKTILQKLLADREGISVVNDQFGCPTLADDLVRGISSFYQNDIETGVYHFANSGFTSWYLFAREIAISIGQDPDRIIPMKTVATESNVQRPIFSVLSTEKFQRATGIKPPSWKNSLRDSITQIRMALESETRK
jgi:dTDP-4-dehydrorhamnose reductase